MLENKLYKMIFHGKALPNANMKILYENLDKEKLGKTI